MKIETYRCDICEKSKKDFESWFQLNVITDGAYKRLLISPFYDPAIITEGIKDICGVECLNKAISRGISSWS